MTKIHTPRLTQFNPTSFCPYIIANAGNVRTATLAKQLMSAASYGGASAIKFERTGGNLTTADCAHMAERAKILEIDLLVEAYTIDDVTELDEFLEAHSLCGADISNIPYLRAIASFGKPVFLNTEGCYIEEIEKALKELRTVPNVILLHGVMMYPTPIASADLSNIHKLGSTFPSNIIGYSDTTEIELDGDLTALHAAADCGAIVLERTIEQMVALQPNKKGMTKFQLERFKAQRARRNTLMLPCEFERQAPIRKLLRRGIYAAEAIPEGALFTERNLITHTNACHGIAAADWDKLLGQKATKVYAPREPIQEKI